jgi:hypothetical protein
MTRKRRSPNASHPVPKEARLLLALATVERLAAVGGAVHAGWAVALAAQQHAVDRLALAELWLTKLLACSLARANAAAMDEADDAERSKP